MMSSIQIVSMSGLLSLALLLTACQPAGEPDQPLAQVTAISQVAIAASPTALPTPTDTPSPTTTPSPTATPTLAYTSQGDQLPTRSPTSQPTPTAIPAEEPVPSTIATRPLPTPTLAPVSEVDLPALEESLVLLDRLERRKGKPTPTPVRPIIYQGGVSYTVKVSLPGGCPCPACEVAIFSAEIFMGANGTITGKLDSDFKDLIANDAISFAGTVNSLTSIYDFTQVGYQQCTGKLQAKLVDNGQKFEGTLDATCDSGCGDLWSFSLDRK